MVDRERELLGDRFKGRPVRDERFIRSLDLEHADRVALHDQRKQRDGFPR